VFHIEVKVFDSELKIMEVLWEEGDTSAGQLAKILKARTGWNRNTTYTVINKLIGKGAIERYGSNFICKAVITKDMVQRSEATELMVKLFNGSAEMFLSAFLSGNALSEDEIARLKRLVDQLGDA
jgi:predicted transcriptional regulator